MARTSQSPGLGQEEAPADGHGQLGKGSRITAEPLLETPGPSIRAHGRSHNPARDGYKPLRLRSARSTS
jgi:hypothetical protein